MLIKFQIINSLHGITFLNILKTFNRCKTSWIEPSGYDTGISLYNPIVKQKVKLITKKKGIVSWYCCGPTVYNYAHIGNFCSFMRFDIIRRIMKDYFGLEVIMVMNITDIDDKIIVSANKFETNFKILAKFYERAFFNDLSSLNIQQPTIVARVSEHIPEIVEFIQSLIENGYGYIASDGSVYFSVSKYAKYGLFQKVQDDFDPSELKENRQDFCLWKAAKPGEPFWDSPFGRGRPGWHIECSALACKFLGTSVDLHSGGIDLRFPHHENEEAQCCARHGLSQWVNYWLHTGLLFTNENAKMSKSLQNTISVKEFLSKYSSNTFRTFCLMVPYQNDIDFRIETIEKAETVNRKVSQFIIELESYLKGEEKVEAYIDEECLLQAVADTERIIRQNLADDFDTTKIVNQLLFLISTTHLMLKNVSNTPSSAESLPCLAVVKNYIQNILLQLGYDFSVQDNLKSNTPIEDLVTTTINFRNKIREVAMGIKKTDSQELIEKKNLLLGACDDLRNELSTAGIELKDRRKTTTWSYTDSGVKFTANMNMK